MASPNKTRVQVATDPAFSNIVHDVEGAYTTALQVAEEILPQGINLYARGMHGHPTTGDSSWSTTVQFKITAYWSDYDGSADGLMYTLNSVFSVSIETLKISENKVLVLFLTPGDYKSNAVILTVSGSQLITSQIFTMGTSYFNFKDATLLTPTRVLVAHTTYGNNTGKLVLLDIANDQVTMVSELIFRNARTQYVELVKLNENKVLLMFTTVLVGSDPDKLYGSIVSIDSNTLSLIGTSSKYISTTTSSYLKAVPVSNDRIFVAHRIPTVYASKYYLLQINATKDNFTVISSVDWSTQLAYLDVVKIEEDVIGCVYSIQVGAVLAGGLSIFRINSDNSITELSRIIFKSTPTAICKAELVTPRKIAVLYYNATGYYPRMSIIDVTDYTSPLVDDEVVLYDKAIYGDPLLSPMEMTLVSENKMVAVFAINAGTTQNLSAKVLVG